MHLRICSSQLSMSVMIFTHQVSDRLSQLPDFLLQVQVPLCQSLHHLLRPQGRIHLKQSTTASEITVLLVSLAFNLLIINHCADISFKSSHYHKFSFKKKKKQTKPLESKEADCADWFMSLHSCSQKLCFEPVW